MLTSQPFCALLERHRYADLRSVSICSLARPASLSKTMTFANLGEAASEISQISLRSAA